MVMEMMGLVNFWELVTKAENCQGLVMLYKEKGGGVCDFPFTNTGDQS